MAGTLPVSAAKAMGIAQAKAAPKKNCGKKVKRLVKGYSTAKNKPPKESQKVRELSVSTNKNERNTKPANSASACLALRAPVAKGRPLVRSTLPSMLRSAKSLITHPAARIAKTPRVNTTTTFTLGVPAPAIQTAHKVGQSSSMEPMGFSSRIN